MRWSRNEAVGFLHRFWWSVLEVSPTGDVTALTSPEVMSETLNMKLDVVQDAILKLEEAGFLHRVEGRLLVKNWLDYAGRYLSTSLYRRDRKGMKKVEGLHCLRRKSVVRQSSDKRPTDDNTLPYLTLPTLPTLPEPNTLSPPFDPDKAFDEVWALYPSKDGRKAASRHFRSSVKSLDDFERIKKALTNYLACETVKNGFIKNGSTWFNNWEDWVNYSGPPKGVSNVGGNVGRRVIEGDHSAYKPGSIPGGVHVIKCGENARDAENTRPNRETG
jgi:hypothetical protein